MNVIRWDGTPISKPGIYEKVPIDLYHSGRLCAGPSISRSGLWTIIDESEAHFYDRWPINPDHDPDADKLSEAIVLGRATHHLLLGEPSFQSEFVIRPDLAPDAKGAIGPWNGNKTYCQKWLADQKAARKCVISSAQLDRVKGMALSLSRQQLVRQGALNGLIETTMVWKDEESGMWLLNRPDVIPTDSGDFVDLKTTQDIFPAGISSSIGNYGYHMQAALVRDGFKKITGNEMSSFSLYFIESKRPYCCELVRVTDADLKLGHDLYREALKRFIYAFNNDVWPGPGGTQTVERYISVSQRERDRQMTLIQRGSA